MWTQENLSVACNKGFANIVWTEESSIQLEIQSGSTVSINEKVPQPKPSSILIFILIVPFTSFFTLLQSKTSHKDACVGRTRKGPNSIVIFEGMMDSQGYVHQYP